MFLDKVKKIAALCVCVTLAVPMGVRAETDYEAQMEERKSLPVQSNEIADWPEGPPIGAEAAIVMEMNTHTILYAKNIHEELYPASTTKIMTCLLAAQNCSLDETVTFSHDAVYGVPSDGSNMGMDEGESITLEQAMYGVLVGSANEAASAVGEHVAQALGKDADDFADLMNEKADELGCQNTHFTNANGLFDENHYTSAYDLALIGCEFFSNELLCKMSSTVTYNIPPTATQPDDIWITSKNQLFEGKPYEYEYLLGSKTGFVAQSRQTLVSAAEKNGMKLVCVVFMEESPYQFEDTVKLFNYGFENFQKLMVSDYETEYQIENTDPFETDNDLFGDSTPLMTMEEDAYIILPSDADFTDADSVLEYAEDDSDGVIATISYTYSDEPVGSCDILFSKVAPASTNFSTDIVINEEEPADEDTQDIIFIDVKKVVLILVGVAVALIAIFWLISFISSYNFSPKGESNKRKRKRSREARAERRAARRALRLQKRLQRKRRKDYKKRRH